MRRIICFVLLISLMCLTSCGQKKTTSEFTQSGVRVKENPAANSEASPLKWDEITDSGINEEMLINNVNTDILKYIASELQALVDEEAKAEKNNPEVLLTEGWVRVFKSAHYENVLKLGQQAMKPLYFIIYKSSAAGQYEYICAYTLYKLSGYNFAGEDGTLCWSTSKEFLKVFNRQILSERKH